MKRTFHRCRRLVTALFTVMPLLGGPCVSAGAHAATITDMAGRTVEIPHDVHRIVLGEGRLIYALAPLEREHLFDRIVGWQGEFRTADTQSYDQYVARFPAAAKVALIGKTTADTISPEKVLDLRPDLAILTISGHGPGASSELVSQLQAAHVPVVFVDFRANPLHDTVPSMRILGTVLNRQAEAQDYITFYQSHLDRVTQAIAKVPMEQRPKVFIEMLAAMRESCCHTAGKGNMGAFIEAAGGRNIAPPCFPAISAISPWKRSSPRTLTSISLTARKAPGRRGRACGWGRRFPPTLRAVRSGQWRSVRAFPRCVPSRVDMPMACGTHFMTPPTISWRWR
ncbi:ABC transporter substrate-binding protein [Novacetimonas cocois]|uniref:ABC transporter substrate-binding protein n=1 Tax=Novacetimonas cocois TaxID=1747507 RepID=UPI0023B28CF9|nr:ABC transporter substrate-binding protein [Novacetimonas cocois]